MQLSAHIVTDISTSRVRSRYPRKVGRNSFRGHHGAGEIRAVVIVTTDRGASGWGLPLAPFAEPDAVIGKSVAELIDPDSGVVAPPALALDYALHDLAARILDVPVWEMLGATGSTAVEVYSGAIYFDDLDPVDHPAGLDMVRRNLGADFDAGYRSFKLKAGRGYRWMPSHEGLERDIAVTQLARELYPDARLLIDPNDGYTVNDAIAYLDAVSTCSLYWMEETFAEREDDMRVLRSTIDELSPGTLIADGEFQPDVQALLGLARQHLVDVALMDVVGFGLTSWRHAMPEFADLGVAASPHAWGDPIKTLYAAQLAAGLGNVPIIEGVPGWTDGVDASAYGFAEGILSVPDAPGFGLELMDAR